MQVYQSCSPFEPFVYQTFEMLLIVVLRTLIPCKQLLANLYHGIPIDHDLTLHGPCLEELVHAAWVEHAQLLSLFSNKTSILSRRVAIHENLVSFVILAVCPIRLLDYSYIKTLLHQSEFVGNRRIHRVLILSFGSK